MNKDVLENLIESLLRRKEGMEKVVAMLEEQAAQFKTKGTEKHRDLHIQTGFLMAVNVILKDIEYYKKKGGDV